MVASSRFGGRTHYQKSFKCSPVPRSRADTCHVVLREAPPAAVMWRGLTKHRTFKRLTHLQRVPSSCCATAPMLTHLAGPRAALQHSHAKLFGRTHTQSAALTLSRSAPFCTAVSQQHRREQDARAPPPSAHSACHAAPLPPTAAPAAPRCPDHSAPSSRMPATNSSYFLSMVVGPTSPPAAPAPAAPGADVTPPGRRTPAAALLAPPPAATARGTRPKPGPVSVRLAAVGRGAASRRTSRWDGTMEVTAAWAQQGDWRESDVEKYRELQGTHRAFCHGSAADALHPSSLNAGTS